jgi:hypothetical protein
LLVHFKFVLWEIGAPHLSNWFGTRGSLSILVWFIFLFIGLTLIKNKQYLGREDGNVPIYGFPYSTVVDDLMGLCQFDQRGNLRLTVGSYCLEELYDAFRGSFIIFHHRDHSYVVRILFCCISTIPVIWEY